MRGVDVLSARDDAAMEEPDPWIFARAGHLARVLVTHDRDFLRLAAEAQHRNHPFPGLILLTRSSQEIEPSLSHLELFTKVYDESEVRDRVFYLPYPEAER